MILRRTSFNFSFFIFYSARKLHFKLHHFSGRYSSPRQGWKLELNCYFSYKFHYKFGYLTEVFISMSIFFYNPQKVIISSNLFYNNCWLFFSEIFLNQTRWFSFTSLNPNLRAVLIDVILSTWQCQFNLSYLKLISSFIDSRHTISAYPFLLKPSKVSIPNLHEFSEELSPHKIQQDKIVSFLTNAMLKFILSF